MDGTIVASRTILVKVIRTCSYPGLGKILLHLAYIQRYVIHAIIYNDECKCLKSTHKFYLQFVCLVIPNTFGIGVSSTKMSYIAIFGYEDIRHVHVYPPYK